MSDWLSPNPPDIADPLPATLTDTLQPLSRKSKANPRQLFCAFDPKRQSDQSMVPKTFRVLLDCNIS